MVYTNENIKILEATSSFSTYNHICYNMSPFKQGLSDILFPRLRKIGRNILYFIGCRFAKQNYPENKDSMKGK